jgi:hypothetical protein
MFVTDHFVFMHLPKTGGVYVESVCQESLRFPIHHSRRHAKASELPAQFEALPKIGVWRDPWDWYASLFHFAKIARNGATSELVSLASDGFELGFDDALERLLSPDAALVAAYEAKMRSWGGAAKDFECLDSSSMARAKESGLGLMSFLAAEIFPIKLDEEWRFEELKKSFLARVSPLCAERSKFRAAALAPARNASNKPNLALMYGAASIERVAAKERAIIERWGYRPPGSRRSDG